MRLLPALIVTLSQAADLTGREERLRILPDEQAALTQRVTNFLTRMGEKY